MNTPTEAEKIEQILLQLVEDFMDFSDMETRHIWAKDKKVATAAISEMLREARVDEVKSAYAQIINRSSLRVNNYLLKRIAELTAPADGRKSND